MIRADQGADDGAVSYYRQFVNEDNDNYSDNMDCTHDAPEATFPNVLSPTLLSIQAQQNEATAHSFHSCQSLCPVGDPTTAAEVPELQTLPQIPMSDNPTKHYRDSIEAEKGLSKEQINQQEILSISFTKYVSENPRPENHANRGREVPRETG